MKLKPCPFCGNDYDLDIEINPNEDSDPNWFIFCYTCTSFGPYADSKKEAAEKWNARPLEDKK